MSFVTDASLALTWLFEDEQTPARLSLLSEVSRTGCVVPSLWRLEVANGLQVSIRRRRIDNAYRDAAIRKLTCLPIEVDSETDDKAWTFTLHLADLHRLSVYDACYLELSLRRALPLATCDTSLARAASRAGVTLLPA